MKIFVCTKHHAGARIPSFSEKGEWIDLYCAEGCKLETPYIMKAKKDMDRKIIYPTALLDFKISMKLPKGFEAIIAPRSGTFRKYGVMLTNSIGVIDNSYNGTNDTWKAHIICLAQGEYNEIEQRDRLFQFRIQLSQKATIWQKIKWLFTKKIEFVEVEELENINRGGYGSTGR
jgi:dUTP pyrophosphatase